MRRPPRLESQQFATQLYGKTWLSSSDEIEPLPLPQQEHRSRGSGEGCADRFATSEAQGHATNGQAWNEVHGDAFEDNTGPF